MNQQSGISESVLWEKQSQILKELLVLHENAMKKRQLKFYSPMMPIFRKIHWVASFLGLSDFADIAAGGAVFVSKIQGTHSTWSDSHAGMIRAILSYFTAMVNLKNHQIDSNIHELNPRIPKMIHELRTLFFQYQINVRTVSLCASLEAVHAESIKNEDEIPSLARKRHNPDGALTLIYLDLGIQNMSFIKLIKILEDSVRNSNLILYGTIIPSSGTVQGKGRKLPFYLLLDMELSGGNWLKQYSLNGRVVNRSEVISQKAIPAESTVDITDEKKSVPEEITKSNEMESDTIIIERRSYDQRSKIRKTSKAGNKLSFDADEVKELESVSKKNSARKARRNRKIRNRDLRIRFTVGAKMQLIVSSIIILSMLSLSLIGLYFFRSEISNRIEDTNISLASLVAKQAGYELTQLFDSANLLFQIGASTQNPEDLINGFFANFQPLAYVGISGNDIGFFNRIWFSENRILNENAILQSIMDIRGKDLLRAKNGETVIINVSPLIPNLETPVLAMSAPYLLGTQQEALIILVDIGHGLAESVKMQSDIATTIIINAEGEILVHPDYSHIFGGGVIKDSPVYTRMYSQGATKGQIRFTEVLDDESVTTIGSFSIIPIGNLGVVSTVLEKDAFGAVDRIQRLNLTLLGSILSLSILGVYFFAQSLSIPLKELTLATRMIKARNYDIKLKPHTTDEVGQLTRNFLSMIPVLERVERLQTKTSHFINPQVAKMIADDVLPEDAETKNVTVFFSDIRNFTSMSEQMGDPQLVLNNLSEYFKIVVECIERTDGTVDKYIGDAVMAVWGSMKDLPNNAESAIDGALKIRDALIDFNKNRGSVAYPIFQVGCGMNSGPATVGVMGGGSSKEEWAHMGDTVNIASRVEALNKAMGTDILITEMTSDLVKGIYDLVPMRKIKVKGKEAPLKIYAVLGRLDNDRRPKSLTELRTLLGLKGDFNQVASKEEHEVKYEFLSS